MFVIENKIPKRIEKTTFSDLGMKENDLEEMLRKNIDMLWGEDFSMMIVGQQVRNEKNGRSDLTAIDGEGNIVLIEIKRDKKDIEHRKEAFEFQAIRYAANCASIKDGNQLIQDVYAPYVEKHKEEFHSKYDKSLTSSEIAQRELDSFLLANDKPQFNRKQKIMLVASDFDEQTLSAVAWLNSNNVDISCYQVLPLKMSDKTLIDIKRILPLEDYEDYFVPIATPSSQSISNARSSEITKRVLPRIDKLIEWGVVKEGDLLKAKNKDDIATLLSDGRVKIKSTCEETSMQQWLKSVYGWTSVATYVFAIHVETGKSLSVLRDEYMKSNLE